jgi:hypothetical protein
MGALCRCLSPCRAADRSPLVETRPPLHPLSQQRLLCLLSAASARVVRSLAVVPVQALPWLVEYEGRMARHPEPPLVCRPCWVRSK